MRKLLKEKVEKERSQLLLQPIESGSIGSGIPDIFFRDIHNEGWIELKQLIIKRNKMVYVPFRPGQYPWIKRYVKLNGNMILLGTFKPSIHSLGHEKIWIVIKGKDIREIYTYDEFLKTATLYLLKDVNFLRLLSRQ